MATPNTALLFVRSQFNPMFHCHGQFSTCVVLFNTHKPSENVEKCKYLGMRVTNCSYTNEQIKSSLPSRPLSKSVKNEIVLALVYML